MVPGMHLTYWLFSSPWLMWCWMPWHRILPVVFWEGDGAVALFVAICDNIYKAVRSSCLDDLLQALNQYKLMNVCSFPTEIAKHPKAALAWLDLPHCSCLAYLNSPARNPTRNLRTWQELVCWTVSAHRNWQLSGYCPFHRRWTRGNCGLFNLSVWLERYVVCVWCDCSATSQPCARWFYQ